MMACRILGPAARFAGACALAALAVVVACPARSWAQGVDVLIVSPPRGEPAFGSVELRVEVLTGERVEKVELEIDGELVATVWEPPYRVLHDVGEDNRSHRFVARAFTTAGTVGEAVYESPAFRIDDELDANLRPLYVTVLDGPRRVLDLEASDFSVFDRRQRQELVTFARGDAEIAAAILVDASVSMRGRRLRFALRGAASFAVGLSPEDEAALFLFSDRLLHATPFVSDPSALVAGLAGTEATGGTALNDHVYMALKRLEARQGRRVLILLSDGVDSHSALSMRDVAWLARRSRALIYWVRTDPGPGDGRRYSSWKDAAEYEADADLLQRTVLESGGRIVTLDDIEDTEGAMKEILQELREQYVLGYYPSTVRHDGIWHDVAVEVDRPGLRVRARDGYVDF